MNKISLAFFAGSLVPAIAIVVLGGSSLACFSAGVLSLVIPALLFARKVAGWLYWVSEATDRVRDIKSSTEHHRREHLRGRASSRATGETAGEKYTRRRVAVASNPAKPQDEVETALINLGTSKAKAQLIVANLPPGSFEQRFKTGVAMARKAA